MFETPQHLLQAAFSRGEVSPFLFGRVDLAGWSQALRTLRNFRVRPEGSVSNRPGFHFLNNSLTNTSKASILVPFVFNSVQSYVLEIGNGTAQVFSNNALVNAAGASITNITDGLIGFQPRRVVTTSTPHGLIVGNTVIITGVVATGTFQINGSWQVLAVGSPTTFTIIGSGDPAGAYISGGFAFVPLSFVTPWATQDLLGLRWAQSADTLTVVHPKYPPYEIKRTSATSFTCLQAVYNNGPFLSQNADGVTFVSASAITGTVTLTASAPIFNANHVGALFQLVQQDLSSIPPWEPSKAISGNPAGIYRRASFKNYKCMGGVTTGASYATGSVIPTHTQGTQPDGDGNTISGLAAVCGLKWQYQDSGFGIVKITAFTDSTHVTGIVQPNYAGGPGLLPPSVVGGSVGTVGPFTFSGDGSTKTFQPLTGATSADSSSWIVTVNGTYQPPGLYTITLGTPNTITFLTAPPVGTNNVIATQISSFGQTAFWAFGAFSADQGYPSTVTYFPDRIVLAATPAQPVGVFGSKTSSYHDFGVSNPVVASDAFTVFLNARQLNAISDLMPLSDLLVGTSNIIWRLWPGSTGVALSPLAIASTPQAYFGQSPACASVMFGDSAIFPEYDGRRIRDMIYQFAYDKFVGQELTLYSRHLIPFGTSFQRLQYLSDTQGQLVLGLLNNGALPICSYLREQQVIGWAHWDTQGTFEDICVVPESNTFGTYAIVNRLVNGVNVRYVEHLEQREVTTIYDYQFLDCNLTYDGRNSSSTTMTLNGLTTSLAGDTGTLTASNTSGWANFFASDVTDKNEIWIFQTLAFTGSVANQQNGQLISSIAAGTYVVMFSDGESRQITVASDGISCSWQGVLGSSPILTATCRCRLLITSYVSATQVGVRLRDPCPAGLNNIPTSVWTFARTKFSGAIQLAGLPVVAYMDATVYGISETGIAPNGNLIVGLDGTFSTPIASGVITIGLPYLCDFETLPLNAQGIETIRMRAKTNPVIYLDVTECRNFLVGTDFSTANQWPNVERAFEPYVSSIALQQGVQWTRVNSELSAECHTCIRQNMPLPITIRAHIPAVTVGDPIS